MKKYLSVMETLVAQEQSGAARQCLSDLQDSLGELGQFVDVEHPVLSSILSYGMEQANQAGVQLNLDVWLDKAFAISPSDLYIIVGNTLDNAVEACVAVPTQAHRVITLQLHQKNHLLDYEISNPYQKGAMPKPGSAHGYGLKNVRRCVERNHGAMEILNEEGRFTVLIRLTTDLG